MSSSNKCNKISGQSSQVLTRCEDNLNCMYRHVESRIKQKNNVVPHQHFLVILYVLLFIFSPFNQIELIIYRRQLQKELKISKTINVTSLTRFIIAKHFPNFPPFWKIVWIREAERLGSNYRLTSYNMVDPQIVYNGHDGWTFSVFRLYLVLFQNYDQ